MGNTYLKEWRAYRNKTQSQVLDMLELADDPLLPKTGASLSRLENGKQPYSQRVLEALADIYDTSPSDLIGRNPFKEGEIVDFVSRLNERQKAQALAVLEAMSRTSA